jgi:RNA polymerase sigma-70 factor (ECF subfamily)
LDKAPATLFDQQILPHMDAAYNLARWLTGNDRDADDVTQEALLRAFRFFSGFRGGDPKAWLLTIVRRSAWTWLRRNRHNEESVEYDDELHGSTDLSANPETALLRAGDIETVRHAIELLPAALREALVLRELEGCSYKEIADISGVPIGTVMSRISRARRQLQAVLSKPPEKGDPA